jgi:type I restriction enzyme S subunit
MDAETAKLFPDSFEDSELGLIPKGWEVGRLTDVATVLMGTSPKGSTYNDEGIGVPLVNGPAQYGPFFPTKTKWTTAPTQLSKRGDLILCVRGSTTGRRVASDEAYCRGRGVCSIRAKGQLQPFVDLFVDQSLSVLLSHTTGTVFPNLSGPSIKQLATVLSGRQILDAFCAAVTPLRDRIWRNVENSAGLWHLRDALLPKLLSREIRVKHAEKLLEPF